MLISGHKPHRMGPYVYFTCGEGWGGMDCGMFFVVGKDCTYKSLMCHEMGHALQWFWGPLFVFIALWSAGRYWWREFYEAVIYPRNKKPLPPYDSIWFEREATQWGWNKCGKFYDAAE